MAHRLSSREHLYLLGAPVRDAESRGYVLPSASAPKAAAAPAAAPAGGAAKPAAKPVEPDTPEFLAKLARVQDVGEECLEPSELKALMKSRPTGFRLYDGFEPSGRMHIAQGVFKSINVNTCTEAGGKFVFWVADIFALMNEKMGGDMDKIKIVGDYLVEVWEAVGMNMENVEFIRASTEIEARAEEYARTMVDVARRFTVSRLTKCCQIMGRKEGSLTAAQVLYPLMQCTDIFFLKADVCQLGMDQRKVNMLARDYCSAANRKFKPVILSHHMLFGLKQGQEKMSKSDADSAVFMEDSAEDVVRKINQAYCPMLEPDEANPESVGTNPCMDYIKNICMKGANAPPFLGHKDFASVRRGFVSGSITEAQLKQELAKRLNELLEPVRVRFTTNERAKGLLDSVKLFKEQDKKEQALKLAAAAARAGAPPEELTGPDDPDVAAMAERVARRRGELTLPKLLRAKLPGYETDAAARLNVVFAPPPAQDDPRVSLAAALGVVARLRRAAADTEHRVVLWVSDISTVATGALSDSTETEKTRRNKIVENNDKASPYRDVGKFSTPSYEIAAYYDALVSSVKKIAPSELMARVDVVKQSTVMFVRPIEYWLSVINVGRAFPLPRVLRACGISEQEEGGRVGYVVDALMRVADVCAMGPALRIFADPSEMPIFDLALDFLASDFCAKYDVSAMPLPVVVLVERPEIALLKTADAPGADEETTLFVTDDAKTVEKKIKRCFCEIGNVACNPVLNGVVGQVLSQPDYGNQSVNFRLVVERKPENGGRVEFTSVGDVFNAFAETSLHPGDLKAAVMGPIQKLMETAKPQDAPKYQKIVDDYFNRKKGKKAA